METRTDNKNGAIPKSQMSRLIASFFNDLIIFEKENQNK